MQKFEDIATIIGPPGLIPVVGVNVTVYDHGTSTTSHIYSDNSSTVVANPLTTDSSGRYSFYAADGRYDRTISGAGIQTTTLTDITLSEGMAALASTSSTTLGDYLVGVKRTATNAQATNVHAFIEAQPLNVMADFLAVGDGITDDTTAIQNAFNDAIALNASCVVFPPGTYKTSGLTITNYAGQNLAILGFGARILIGSNQVGIAISGSQNVRVSGLSFYAASQSGAAQAGISVTLSSRINIVDNDFRLLTYGVNFVSSALGITTGSIQIPSIISRNTFKACAAGILLGGSGSATSAEYVSVSGNIVNDCTVVGILAQAGNVRITDNAVTGNLVGIEIDGSLYPNADHGAVIGNTINHNSKCGLYVHDTSANYSYLITGNNVWANIYSNFGAGSYAHPFGVILKTCANINFTSNIVARNTVNLGVDVLTTSMVANNTFMTDSTATLYNIYEISAITVANGNKMAPNTFQGTLVASANNNDYEQVYTIGATGAPAFQNSWANLGAGFDSAAYSKDASGVVHLYGAVAGGTGLSTAIFTLPAGFRPATKKIWAGLSNNLLGAIQIDTAGIVQANVGTTTWQTLSNVSFKAEA